MSKISPDYVKLLQKKTFAEFFAGIGLVRMGLERLGWSVAFSNDIDPSKYQMYKGHFTDAENIFVLDDIFKLNTSDIPPVTLATASFPCKDLSLAGARKGFDGVHSSTIWGFSRILERMQENKPPLVMLENVTGFLSANKGQDFLHTLLDLNDLGYVVDAFILDAVHFVPQSRPRLFVVGLLENAFPQYCKSIDLFGLESEIRPKNLAAFIINHPQVKWAIRSLPPLPSNHCLLDTIVEDSPERNSLWWSSERAAYLLTQMSPRHRQIVEKMIHDSRWSYGTIFRRMRNGKSTAELRTDGIAGCLRTPSGGSAKQILIKAGYGRYFVRLITPREAARLMGAGDYNITVPFDRALFGFGDAVCVSVIEWIARNYFEELIKEKLQEDTSQGKHQNCYGENKLMTIEPEMQARLQEIYNIWYAGIDKDDGKSGWGSICGGITTIENLLTDYTLDISQHRTKGGTQLKNQGLALGNRVLKKFNTGERLTTGEFGRTSRGAPRAAERLLNLLGSLNLENMPQAERNEILTFIESNMVKVLVSLLQREKKLVNFDPALTTEKSIEVLLESAEGATSGAIAQHLVGAKLQLRWPHIPIPNDSASTADAPTSRPGDFLINQGVVHVTMSPQDAVFAKCRSNLNQGYSVYLLVPNKRLSLAITKAKRLGIVDNITIKSIESFIAQNIDEIAEFSKEELSKQREELLRIYNKRVREAHERHAPFLVLKEGTLFEIGQEEENEPTKLGVNDQQSNISPTSSSSDFYVSESLFTLTLKEEETYHND